MAPAVTYQAKAEELAADVDTIHPGCRTHLLLRTGCCQAVVTVLLLQGHDCFRALEFQDRLLAPTTLSRTGFNSRAELCDPELSRSRFRHLVSALCSAEARRMPRHT